MSWFDVLKTDTDFKGWSKDGRHAELLSTTLLPKHGNNRKRKINFPYRGDDPERQPNIKIYEKTLWKDMKEDYLQYLKRLPTEDELIDTIFDIFNHEEVHAGHLEIDDKFYIWETNQLEYIAYALQNVNDPIIHRLENYLAHPKVINTDKGNKMKKLVADAKAQTFLPPDIYVKLSLGGQRGKDQLKWFIRQAKRGHFGV